MSLHELMKISDDAYGEDIDSIMESNSLAIFKIKDKHTFTTEIEYQKVNKYIGDFYGLLEDLLVPTELYYLTTVLNNLNSSSGFDGTTNVIVLIENSFANKLLNNTPEDYRLPQIK